MMSNFYPNSSMTSTETYSPVRIFNESEDDESISATKNEKFEIPDQTKIEKNQSKTFNLITTWSEQSAVTVTDSEERALSGIRWFLPSPNDDETYSKKINLVLGGTKSKSDVISSMAIETTSPKQSQNGLSVVYTAGEWQESITDADNNVSFLSLKQHNKSGEVKMGIEAYSSSTSIESILDFKTNEENEEITDIFTNEVEDDPQTDQTDNEQPCDHQETQTSPMDNSYDVDCVSEEWEEDEDSDLARSKSEGIKSLQEQVFADRINLEGQCVENGPKPTAEEYLSLTENLREYFKSQEQRISCYSNLEYSDEETEEFDVTCKQSNEKDNQDEDSENSEEQDLDPSPNQTPTKLKSILRHESQREEAHSWSTDAIQASEDDTSICHEIIPEEVEEQYLDETSICMEVIPTSPKEDYNGNNEKVIHLKHFHQKVRIQNFNNQDDENPSDEPLEASNLNNQHKTNDNSWIQSVANDSEPFHHNPRGDELFSNAVSAFRPITPFDDNILADPDSRLQKLQMYLGYVECRENEMTECLSSLKVDNTSLMSARTEEIQKLIIDYRKFKKDLKCRVNWLITEASKIQTCLKKLRKSNKILLSEESKEEVIPQNLVQNEIIERNETKQSFKNQSLKDHLNKCETTAFLKERKLQPKNQDSLDYRKREAVNEVYKEECNDKFEEYLDSLKAYVEQNYELYKRGFSLEKDKSFREQHEMAKVLFGKERLGDFCYAYLS